MRFTFVESIVFSPRWKQRSDAESLRQLQLELLADQDKGDPIPGCPIIRKIRFSDTTRSKGKRGGLRVIYVHTPAASRIDLITVYAKNEAENLSPDEVKQLCSLARLLRDEATASAGAKNWAITRKKKP